MSFGTFDHEHSQQTIAEINTTPLIDVLLVLLVVFLVTLPLTSTMIPVDLPRAEGDVAPVTSAVLEITVDQKGQIFYKDQPIRLADVETLFVTAEQEKQQLRLRVDARTQFEEVAQLLSIANKHQISYIGFVTVMPESIGQ
jgi:biopolymer transport protein ExbD